MLPDPGSKVKSLSLKDYKIAFKYPTLLKKNVLFKIYTMNSNANELCMYSLALLIPVNEAHCLVFPISCWIWKQIVLSFINNQSVLEQHLS